MCTVKPPACQKSGGFYALPPFCPIGPAHTRARTQSTERERLKWPLVLAASRGGRARGVVDKKKNEAFPLKDAAFSI